MSYRFQLDEFEGPLDLLLKLIEDEKLDITTISLAKVTDQYLAYIEHEENLPPTEVADFLVVAAKLIYLKSKYLLPALTLEEDDGADLEQQLKLYREYYEASKKIAAMLGKKRFAFARQVPYKPAREKSFSPPPGVTVMSLADAFRTVLGRLETIVRLPKIVLATAMSIREKINGLRDALERGLVTFHQFYDKSNKQDIIVSFLALLELVKRRDAAVRQSGLFAEIIISKHDGI